jgi:Brp/Blh family beta-carotene 15,15'-monooxygenase
MNMSLTRHRGFPVAGILLATISAIGLVCLGVNFDTSLMTAAASAAILILGLPHGSFDLALIRRSAGNTSSLALVSLYLSCATAMYLLWQIEPILALAGFLLTAVVHFSEDWEACGSRFVASGIAVAIVATPALLHADSLRGLFVALTGDPGAAVLVDALLLVAPIALVVALVGIGMLWQAGLRGLAVSAGSALAGLLLLPPVVGFALFFCLVHSPMQFRQHADTLSLRGFRQWAGIVVPISLGGLGIAAAIFLADGRSAFAASMFASSFMTLSILTVPHMAVPFIASRFISPRQLAVN